MEIARQFQDVSARAKQLKKDLAVAMVEQRKLEAQVLQLIEDGRLPESFSLNGKPIYTREELWASPADGNHARLVSVLRELGLVEYLPSNVNSQSMSAYVRGFRDPETGEIVGLPEDLAAALKITKKPRVIAAGLG